MIDKRWVLLIGIGFLLMLEGLAFAGDISVEVEGELSVDTDTLFIDSTNHRVGIETDTPDEALDVNGDMKLQGGSIKDSAGIVRIDMTAAGNISMKDSSGNAALTVDTSGDVNVANDLTLSSGKEITIPDGMVLSGAAAFSPLLAGENNYYGTPDVHQFDYFNGSTVAYVKWADNALRYPVVRLHVPGPTMFGATVVIDQITMYFENTTVAYYYSSTLLRQTDRDGDIDDIRVDYTDYGNVSAGDFSVPLLNSDVSRADYPNAWVIKFELSAAASGEFRLYDVKIEYHLE